MNMRKDARSELDCAIHYKHKSFKCFQRNQNVNYCPHIYVYKYGHFAKCANKTKTEQKN